MPELSDTHHKLTTLRHSPFFREIPEEDLSALSELMVFEYYKKGDTVCAIGEVADRIFIVSSGTLSIHLKGTKKSVRQMSVGDVIGEYGLFTEEVRTADVVCENNVVLMSLEYHRFKSFLELFPNTTYAVLRETVLRLVSLEQSS